MTAVSLLESVAQHETELMAQVGEAEAQARALVDEAQAQAVALLQQEQARLDEDLAALRRQARDARAEEQQQIAQRAEQRVLEIRSQAAEHREAVKREILARLIPAKQGEVAP